MGIYQRDNINYGGLLGNAMANRMAYAQRDADIQRQMGQNWGNALNQGAQGIAAGLNTWNQQRIDRDKLAQQQQFQAEQKALERANELKRAQEQQKWQAEQNALQRESTENIAALNRNASTNQQIEEKQAQSIMHYDIQKGIVDSIADEILRTDDPSKLAQLYRQRDEALAKMNYYAASVPESYKGPKVGESFQGFTFGMGQDRTPQTTVVAEAPVDTRQQSVRYADFVSKGKSATTSKDVDAALANIATVDTSKLTTPQKEALEKDKNELTAKAAQLRKQEAFAAKIKNWKIGDPVPQGYKINFINGKPAGLKKK